jgi:uncharacterized membrane protein YdjX (TVP38/TMEM64 family)
MTAAHDAQPTPAPKKSLLVRLAPLLVIAAAIAIVFAMGWHKYLSLDALSANLGYLNAKIEENLPLAMAAFALLYALVVVLSLPGAGILTIAGGVLFGWIGVIPTVLGATLGATALFVAAKTAFRDLFSKAASGFVAKFEKGFQENEFSYMMILRLVPLFPFFVVNIVPAFLGVKLRNYFIATLIGIIPGSMTYTLIGAAGRDTIAKGGELDLGGALTQPTVLAAIGGLIVLSLIPIIYKRFGKKQQGAV